MSYIRTKKISGSRYAYLVDNVWEDGRSRQKVRKYLGKVYALKKTKGRLQFSSTVGQDLDEYMEEAKAASLTGDAARYELLKHGFEQKDELLVSGKLVVDMKARRVYSRKDKDVVLGLNEGYLCEETLNGIFSAKLFGEDDREQGLGLARLFVDAGIQIPKEIFISLFSKLKQ